MRTYARIIGPGCPVLPGDVFFESGNRWTSLLIRFGSLSSHSHVGVVLTETDGEGTVWVAEAIGVGFVTRTRDRLPAGYVVRFDDHGPEIAAAARALAGEGKEYDWATILFHAVKFFDRGVARPFTGWLLGRLSKRIRKPNRVICSEAVLLCLDACEEAEIDYLLRPLADRPRFSVTPADLFRCVVGRRDG